MLLSINELVVQIPDMCRLMGLDPGSKTVGVAISDLNRMIATPALNIRRKKYKDLVGQLSEFMQSENIGGIVVGLPLNMDGSFGPSAQSATHFARNLSNSFSIPVSLWDERLSTAAVERALISADISRRKRAKLIDKLSAAYLLQGALDYIAHNQNSNFHANLRKWD